MGLLDDAIREHLELKRKHGADPEDVARQEQEALGPGQRNEFAQPAAEAEPAPPPPSEEEEPAPEEEPPAAVAASELPEGEPGIPEEPTAEHPAAAPGYDEDPWLQEDQDEGAAQGRRGERGAGGGEGGGGGGGRPAAPRARRAAHRRGGRAGGDAGVPPGDAR